MCVPKIISARSQQNEMRTHNPKWDVHAQPKIKCACTGQNEVLIHIPIWDAHAQSKVRCAGTTLNEINDMRMRYAQPTMRFTCASLNDICMRVMFCRAYVHPQLICAGASHFSVRTCISFCSAQTNLILVLSVQSIISPHPFPSPTRLVGKEHSSQIKVKFLSLAPTVPPPPLDA